MLAKDLKRVKGDIAEPITVPQQWAVRCSVFMTSLTSELSPLHHINPSLFVCICYSDCALSLTEFVNTLLSRNLDTKKVTILGQLQLTALIKYHQEYIYDSQDRITKNTAWMKNLVEMTLFVRYVNKMLAIYLQKVHFPLAIYTTETPFLLKLSHCNLTMVAKYVLRSVWFWWNLKYLSLQR